MAEGHRHIVIKKLKKHQRSHGGQWKIAYADFITAMMAFFLLMWLLGSSTKAELRGIAEYFQSPLQVLPRGGSGAQDGVSIINGGGRDLMRHDGRVGEHNSEAAKKRLSLKEAQAELERLDTLRLENLKKRLERLIESNPTMRQFTKQLLLDITTEGLRIQVVDDKNRPMFGLAKAELEPHTRDILQKLGGVLNEMPNKISLSGHTDATPYASGEKNYSNWELSADRANASRRELISGGMHEQKMMRVVGLSSAVLFDKDDPVNPINRRISIIVMSKKAEEALSKEDGQTKQIKANTIVDLQAPRPSDAS
ncbi:flagellar motor protein MotB [Nitrosovibrio tenuis]|uniref:Chemotaxis protein MotB n=1 Tax=Nitrosovibrio tenuis TaxID=1233 RepID=A0A1H7JAH6_9PROT|nr:flagellar motor protein MotB [Nitrosovibrio tenuis]SEK70970.1 chemotaxis protein MotB [Nitrosovibrio tenuis]